MKSRLTMIQSVNLFLFRIWQQHSNYVFQIYQVIDKNDPFISEAPKRKPLFEISCEPGFKCLQVKFPGNRLAFHSFKVFLMQVSVCKNPEDSMAVIRRRMPRMSLLLCGERRFFVMTLSSERMRPQVQWKHRGTERLRLIRKRP